MRAANNGGVIRLTARVASGLVIAPFLLFGSALTPVHVHELAADHAHAVVHSHFEPHHLESDDADGPELEPAAGRLVWLNSAIREYPSYRIDPGPPITTAAFAAVVFAPSWSRIPFDEGAPVHGGPPFFPPDLI